MNGMTAMTWAAELDKQFRERGGDPRFVSADGQQIRDGEWFWDYDLRLAKVVFAKTSFGLYWDGWFAMQYVDGTSASIMNGTRLCSTHPSTGQKARDRLKEETA